MSTKLAHTLDVATLAHALALIEEAVGEATAEIGGRSRRTYGAGLASGRVCGLTEAAGAIRGQMLACEVSQGPVVEAQGEQAPNVRKSRAEPREHAPGTVGTDAAVYTGLRRAFFGVFGRWHSKSTTDDEKALEEMRRWALYQRWWGVHHLSEVPIEVAEASRTRLLNMSEIDISIEFARTADADEKGVWL